MDSNNYTYISTATTTSIGAAAPRRTCLASICVNKTLTGTLTIKDGANTIGILAIGTVPNVYWYSDGGTVINDLQLVTSAADDITILWSSI